MPLDRKQDPDDTVDFFLNLRRSYCEL